MSCIAVIQKKGGSGKSMTALSLGAIYAARGKPVLLVDADPQATVTNYFPPPTASLFDALHGLATLKEAAFEVRPKLRLLGADRRLEDPRVQWEKLPELLASYRGRIIIDAPAGWHPAQQAIVKAAGDYLIPINSEMAALESGLAMQQRALTTNRGARFAGYLLTCWRESSPARQVAAVEVAWLPVRIPRDERVNRLSVEQRLITEGYAGGVRQAYEELADILEKRLK